MKRVGHTHTSHYPTIKLEMGGVGGGWEVGGGKGSERKATRHIILQLNLRWEVGEGNWEVGGGKMNVIREGRRQHTHATLSCN